MFTDSSGATKEAGASFRNYFPNPSYAHGEWCGFVAAGPKEPVDGLDNACKLHDDAYGYGTSLSGKYSDYNFLNPDYSKFEARIRTNLNLASEGLKLAFTENGGYLFDGILTAAFGLTLAAIDIAIIEPIGLTLRLLGL
jgi:hypothetical protein